MLKKFLVISFLSLALFCKANIAIAGDWKPDLSFVTGILDESSTPRGMVIIAIVNSFIGGTGNFIWAFNWQLHTNCSAVLSARLQEAGGLMCSAQCFILGGAMTYLLYRYHQEREPPQDTEATETPQLDGIGDKEQ